MGTDMETGQQNAARGGTYRAALAAVIILSVLLVAGMVALIFGFMRQYALYRGAHGTSAGAGGPAAVVSLEPGARIVSVHTMPNRLILQLATPKGGEVEVLDLTTGKLLYRVATPAP